MKRRALCFIMAAVMAFGFSGCKKSDNAQKGEVTPGGTQGTQVGGNETNQSTDPVTIKVWTINRHDESYMKEMVEKFNNENKDIKIEYTIMSDDYTNSIQMAYKANQAPDIITIAASDGFNLTEYVDAGMFASLTDYINADSEFQKITEIKDHKYEGLNSIGDDIYWAPNGVRSGTRIEYNKELLKAAGYDKVPATLEEVITMAAKVTEAGKSKNAYGVGFTSSVPFERWLEGAGEMSGFNHGGYDYKTGTYDFTDWKPLIEEAARLYKEGSVLPGSETQGVDNSRALFAEGTFAIWGNASQEAKVFTDQFPCKFDWGVAELPTMDGEVKGALTCTPNVGYTMISSCKNKDAAWKVIQYFSSEEFLKGYFEGGFGAPISKYMQGAIDNSKIGRLADFTLQDYENVYPATPTITLEGDKYNAVFFNAILGNITADEAIADLNKRYNEALERGLANGSCKRLVIEDYNPLHPSEGTRQYLDK